MTKTTRLIRTINEIYFDFYATLNTSHVTKIWGAVDISAVMTLVVPGKNGGVVRLRSPGRLEPVPTIVSVAPSSSIIVNVN